VRVTAKTTEIEGRLILQGVFRDISERKERERKLKESEARLKAIFDFMPALLVAVDSNFNIIAWNKECERVTGFTEDDMVGNPKALEFILPDKSYRADSLNRFKSIGLDFRDEEVTLQTKDGESRIISWSSVTSLCPIPGWSQWAVGIDVTSRKEAENELIATQRRLELAIEAAGLTIWDYDLKTGKAFRDEYWAQRLGYEPEEVEPSIGAWIKLVHPDDIDHVATAFSNHQHGLTPYYETEHRLKSRSGDWFWNLAQAKIVEWDSQGLPSRLTGVSMDITSRKKIELDFQNSEAEKKAILNGISSNVIFLNKDLEIVWANRAAEETYGMSRGNITGFKCCYHLCFQNRDPHQSCPALRTFQTGRPERNEFEKEDGRIWGAGTSPVFSENGEVTGVVCISKDITDEKKAQEIMVQSEKYKAVADLTAGVAHNFNNLLQIVLGNTDLAVLDLRSADFSSLENNLSEIKRAARFGAETVRRLNRFVRREQPHGEYEIDLFDLSDLVEQVISMSKSVWKTEPEKLGLQVNLDCHLRSGCLVKANKAELFEVILNLIKNAVEALPQGGDIVIRTQRDQDKILLSVQDNGIGIPEENINRLFTPFYTTNAESGRGLGLATCRSVLKAHNGDITVRSQLGVGSLFTVELPYASETVEQAEGCAPSGSGTLSILIVDDNKPILEILKKGLEANGHTVYAALSGQEALKIFDDATLDAVVCDLSMPGMDGWQVGQAIQERRLKSGANPIPFIIFTGWIDEAQDEQKLKASGVDLVVEKPIGPDKLLDILFKLI
jgi:PAS domain S-box-containing protein